MTNKTTSAIDLVERLTEAEQFRELGRLYNYSEDDSQQFTRWQMTTAIAHGYRLASEGSADTITRLQAALTDAREAIASLDEFALGGVDVTDTVTGDVRWQYGIRDELLAKIDEALRSSVGGE